MKLCKLTVRPACLCLTLTVLAETSFPRNFRESRDFWNGRDCAADNYPFMVLTAAMTDRPLMNRRLLDILHTEIRLTSRLGRLPDDYSFSKRGWRREKLNLDEMDITPLIHSILLTIWRTRSI